MTRLIQLLALLGLPALVLAQSASGYQQLSMSDLVTPSTISAGVTLNSTRCEGTLETAKIRVLWTGAVPTTTSGQPMYVGDRITLANATDIRNFKAIIMSGQSGSSVAVLNLTCAGGTLAERSFIAPATSASTSGLPICNPLYKAAGVSCQ
jgi:hypothetical protein